jgi:hypothetical protein
MPIAPPMASTAPPKPPAPRKRAIAPPAPQKFGGQRPWSSQG